MPGTGPTPERSPGRPAGAGTRLSGEARRGQLVREAIRAFGMRGYDGTSLEAVAEAAGVRKQTLLYYFATKEELFDACVDEMFSGLQRTLMRVLDVADDGWPRVERIIRSIFRLAERWPEFPLFVREAARRSPDVMPRVAGALDPLRKRAVDFLERGMDAGVFRRQDPGLLLFTLYTAVVGSLTEAGALRAVAGGTSGRTALRHREEELLAFVRSALEP